MPRQIKLVGLIVGVVLVVGAVVGGGGGGGGGVGGGGGGGGRGCGGGIRGVGDVDAWCCCSLLFHVIVIQGCGCVCG